MFVSLAKISPTRFESPERKIINKFFTSYKITKETDASLTCSTKLFCVTLKQSDPTEAFCFMVNGKMKFTCFF